ncbi:hypothetical protein G4D61_15475 [Bacillus ginsengihumi]|uniref:Uncharacterized protein n=1 Tax=Heyndrickxia ginsengihumi TaxID=363870 RepID=A0A0A6VF52_9BACI|nr:hypothetical protein [Heyndrickxia ginsengihumi]KHD86098.1 hypothetical protein NG54_04905 [Heyndrickxia ginsengihumi]NEY21344.1 hypothetical protein [Heyndrickxia ginsengihumi]
MEWTLAILFVVSALLFIISMSKSGRASKEKQNEIDMIHMAVMNEINDVKETIRDIELDIEIVSKEAGVQISSQEKLFLREILDLYKRNYSIESIADKKQVSASEIKQLLTPYLTSKDERRKVADEI